MPENNHYGKLQLNRLITIRIGGLKRQKWIKIDLLRRIQIYS
jgi:hypothetical protein